MTSERASKWLNLRLMTSGASRSIVAISLLFTGLVAGLKQLGVLQPAELLIYDQMVRWQPDKGPDPRLLLVAITEADIKAQSQWPLSDETLARLLRNLQVHQPKVIGLDIYRNIPVPPGYSQLLKELQAPNLIAIERLNIPEGKGVAPPPSLPRERIGFNDIVRDPDSVVRRNFMFTGQPDGEDLYSFSLRVSLKYLEDQNYSFKADDSALYIGQTTFPVLEPFAGGYQNVDAEGYQVLLSYQSRDRIADSITVSQVLKGDFNPALVKDRIVLIGSTAPSLGDNFTTPFSAVARDTTGEQAGVVIHAHLISQILRTTLDQQPLFWFWPRWAELLWLLGWGVVGSSVAWKLRHPLALGFIGVLTVGILGGISFAIFIQAGWVPIASPALVLVFSGAGIVAYKLLYSAFHDELSGLPNRALFLQRLRWILRRQQRSLPTSDENTASTEVEAPQPAQKDLLAVLLLGLDRFKAINDSMGHHAGDQLLIKTSQRLKRCFPPETLIARVGGDEFAVVLQGIHNTLELNDWVEQIHEEMAAPFVIASKELFTSVSLGIALNDVGQQVQPEDLLRDAHTAMYRAKSTGKSRHQVFAAGMRTQVMRRLHLETELHRALEQNEFQLYYQPIVALRSGKVVGFEALLRWPHPQEGFIPPSEFIPVAEDIGLIIPLGQWIARAACAQISTWQAQFFNKPPLVVSVNLSLQQFTQPGLVEHIEKTLQETGLDGRSLKLEITESMAMADIEATIVLLQRLKALNVQLSLDDFGTGYSSLSHLHRLPIDTLKVDRSFVNQIDELGDSAIVQTIIVLGHTLKMDVVAEGIETVTQRDRLHELDCEYGQGYFFSKPLPVETATNLLKQDTRFLPT